MVSSAPGVEQRDVTARVRDEQIRLLYQQGAVAFIVNAIVAALLASIIGRHVDRSALIAWCVFFIVAWSLRGVLHVARRLRPDALTPQSWLALFAVGTFLAGATWGMTALWLFPASTVDRFLDAVAIMGLASGAAASLSCVRGMYTLYLVPAFLPIAIRFALENGGDAFVIIALSVLYCVGMSIAAGINYRQLTSALTLRFENDDLVSRLEELAARDPLTGLANRRMLSERLDASLRRSKRSHEMLAVIFVDCDGFKRINDTYGHAAGDEFLKTVARALQGSVRETDTVARLGGDEFLVLLENPVDQAAIEMVVQRMRARALEAAKGGETAVTPRLSIGIALHPKDAADGDTLIRLADQAMYRAKSAGGDGIAFS